MGHNNVLHNVGPGTHLHMFSKTLGRESTGENGADTEDENGARHEPGGETDGHMEKIGNHNICRSRKSTNLC